MVEGEDPFLTTNERQLMRLMYDSVTVADIPPSAPMVAGYANGRFANYPGLKARFPHVPVVSISVNADHHQLAHVLDVERGDATPEEFQGWATAMANAGVRRPTAYCARYMVPALLSLRPAGVIVDLWVADWTGSAHQLTFPGANVVAVQFASPGHGATGHYDISAVWDNNWHQ